MDRVKRVTKYLCKTVIATVAVLLVIGSLGAWELGRISFVQTVGQILLGGVMIAAMLRREIRRNGKGE